MFALQILFSLFWPSVGKSFASKTHQLIRVSRTFSNSKNICIDPRRNLNFQDNRKTSFSWVEKKWSEDAIFQAIHVGTKEFGFQLGND